MIRIVMLGRLGNNLFQYALGRVLAEKHGVPLVMDASWFNPQGWGQVNCIRDLPGPSAGTLKVVRRCSLGARALLRATDKHYWEYSGVPVLKESERDQSFDPSFFEAPADCMLFGYFQSPLYFQGFESRLRDELSTRDLRLEKGRESVADQLRQPNSVAVHVRRTDYVGNADLDLCGVEYYRMAMQRMRESISSPQFYIFSDEPAWAATHLQGPDVEFTNHHAGQSALTDLHLMSLANHHIIANSSYSWWAAWLGEKPGQKVLMPPRWFGHVHAPIEEKRQPHWEVLE